MYGEKAVDFAWNAINGGNPFFLLPASDETLSHFSEHQKLLQAYEKLQKAKKAFY